MARLTIGPTLCALMLSACAPTLDPDPGLSQPAAYATVQSFEAPPPAWPADDWWTAYGDLQLDSLEAEALRVAPNLRLAEARVRSACSTVETTRAALLPQISGEGASKPPSKA